MLALESKTILSGFLGTISGLGGAAAFFAAANVFLAFVAGLFGALTAICTFILVFRKVRAGRRRALTRRAKRHAPYRMDSLAP